MFDDAQFTVTFQDPRDLAKELGPRFTPAELMRHKEKENRINRLVPKWQRTPICECGFRRGGIRPTRAAYR